MLDENQQKELNRLRHDSEVYKARIMNCRNELDDAIYAIGCLDKWRKGRWVGFITIMLATIAGFAVEYFYIIIQGNSIVNNLSNVASAIEFAVSSTAIAFFTVLLLAVSLFAIYIGLKLMLEIGNSAFSRKMAQSFLVKNYYNHVENHLNAKIRLEKELYELYVKKKEVDRQIEELEKDEVPWNFA